jgi:hypothetical protein
MLDVIMLNVLIVSAIKLRVVEPILALPSMLTSSEVILNPSQEVFANTSSALLIIVCPSQILSQIFFESKSYFNDATTLSIMNDIQRKENEHMVVHCYA